jgi:hypothetical protein
MVNAKLLIGLLWFWVIMQGFGNIMESSQTITSADVTDYVAAQDHTMTSTASATGTGINFVDIATGAWNVLGKVFLFDYSVFKDVENLDVNGNASTNEFTIFRILLIMVGAVMWIELAILFKNLIVP